MAYDMLFIIASPRSGSTMLERVLESHSHILGGPEPHVLTPLAHLGVWDKVDKAPYDHVLAAESQRLFVERLPGQEQDYWRACRAYCDGLYGPLMKDSGKDVCLDKTPAYALVLPFMMKVFPDAKYVVLTRHPLAIFASFANSFFDGDYEQAQQYNPLLNRYVPAIAKFLRQKEVPFHHIRYEDFVADPERAVEALYPFIGVPVEKDTVDYGKHEPAAENTKGLGDPIGVQQHSRPTDSGTKKWVEDLAGDQAKLALMRRIVDQLDPEDLAMIGYPLDTLWKPLEDAAGENVAPKRPPLSRYRLQRKAIMRLRAMAQHSGFMRKQLKRLRLVCDVLLRE